MHRIKLHIVAVCVLAILAFSSTASAGEKYTLKLATLSPEDTTWVDYAYKVRDEIKEKSGGRLDIVWYNGGVMGDEEDMVKKIRFGQLQGGVFTLVGLGMMIPSTKIFELPMLFASQEELDFVLEKIEPTFQSIFASNNYAFAGFAEVGFVYLFTNRALNSMADLSKIKMWTWKGDPVAEAALRAIGVGNVVPLNIQEVLTSIQTGLVDSFYATNYTALALQWGSHVGYVTDWHFAYTPGGIVLDKRFFDKLPADLQQLFRKTWEKYLPQLADAIHADEKKSRQALVDSGVKVTKASDEMMTSLVEKSQKVYEQFSGKLYPQSLLTQVLKYRAQFRAQQGKSTQ